LRQLRLFTEAATRAKRRDRADALTDLRVATKFEKREYQSYLKALRR